VRPSVSAASHTAGWSSLLSTRADAYAGLVPRYVIDGLTLLHLVDHGLHVGAGTQLVAPSSIRSEALQILLRDVLDGTRTESAAKETNERATERKLRLLGDRVSRATAWKIAREHGWENLRDAEYLAVTRLQADALVTVDPLLAATAEGIVPIAPLDVLLRGAAQDAASTGGPTSWAAP